MSELFFIKQGAFWESYSNSEGVFLELALILGHRPFNVQCFLSCVYYTPNLCVLTCSTLTAPPAKYVTFLGKKMCHRVLCICTITQILFEIDYEASNAPKFWRTVLSEGKHIVTSEGASYLQWLITWKMHVTMYVLLSLRSSQSACLYLLNVHSILGVFHYTEIALLSIKLEYILFLSRGLIPKINVNDIPADALVSVDYYQHCHPTICLSFKIQIVMSPGKLSPQFPGGNVVLLL